MEKKNYSVMLPTIIAIVTILVTCIGSTFAFFSMNATNNSTSTVVTTTTEGVGTASLLSGNNLTLNLTRDQMMKKDSDVAYYATPTGVSTDETSPLIARATATGETTFDCNYTIEVNVSGTNNMYTAFQGMAAKSEGQIVLTVGNNTYDFNTANLFPNNKLTINGTFTGVSASNEKTLTAQLKFVNKKEVLQTPLEGTDITFTFTSTAFSCVPV